MVQPFNYNINALDPVASLQSGMAFGQQMRAGEQAMDMNQQGMDLRAADEARTVEAFERESLLFDQQQDDRQAALEKAQAQQADLAALAEKIAAGTYSSADFAEVAARNPDLVDEMGKMWEGASVERKQTDTAQLYKGVAAIKAGRPDLAIQMLEDRAVAAENSGDKMEADIARATAEAIKADPVAGLTSLGLLLQTVDPDAAVSVFGKEPEKPAGVVELEWRAQQAGLVPGTPEYQEFIRLDGKTPVLPGTTKVNADGSIEVTRGDVQTGDAIQSVQLAAQTAVAAIDEIMNDPALPGVTGSIEGGGGNDVDQFGIGKRMYYGDAGLGVIQKISQLQNTAWLAARDMLKGGGAITDFESKKAEGAMTRLSRAQGDEEFKAALQDLRDAITEGERKLREAGALPTTASGSGSQPAAADDLDALIKEAQGL